MNYAVIYTRVSSQKQIEEGHGCESQESACRQYCKAHGLTVLNVFHEQAISGASLDRPAFDALCTFLRQQKTAVKVIMDDVSRLARDHILYSHLKTQLTQSGGEICFVNMQFEDSPEGQYVETIIAATAELERKQNARRTKSRMTARAKAGFYLSNAPFGYEYSKHKTFGKILIQKQPDASVIKEALKGFASGRFETQFEVKSFIDQQLNIKLGYNSVKNLLTRIFYAGIIDFPSLGVHVKGKHDSLIDLETFHKIQARLKESHRSYSSKKLVFPLKASVTCESCGSRLTGSISKGRNKRYAYYHCGQTGCDLKGKTIPKAKLEQEFAQLLKSQQVQPFALDMALEMAADLKESLQTRHAERNAQKKQRIQAIEDQIETCLDKILATQDKDVQARFEKRMKTLQLEKAEQEATTTNPTELAEKFRTAIAQCRKLFESPDQLWLEGNEKIQRALPKMVFEEDLIYSRKTGFRTAPKSLPFRVIGGIEQGNYTMAQLEASFSNTKKMWVWFIETLRILVDKEE